MNRNKVHFAAMPMAAAVALFTLGMSKPMKAQAADTIPANTTICGYLTETVDTSKAKVGDRVELKVLQDVKTRDAMPPKGSMLMGRISEATAGTAGHPAKVAMVFDSAQTPDGKSVKLEGGISNLVGTVAMTEGNPDTSGMPHEVMISPQAHYAAGSVLSDQHGNFHLMEGLRVDVLTGNTSR